MTAVAMTKTPSTTVDPIEAARKILNAQASTLAELEAAAAALDHVRGATDVETAGMAARRREILASDGPATEIDRSLERHDAAVSALVRRSEVAAAISTKLAVRLMAAREAAAEAARQAAYDAALKLHDETAKRIKEFCDRVAPEAREVMQAYTAAEAATSAANKNLPAGAAPLMSIEARRQGEPVQPRITERHFKAFMHGRDFVGEVGRYEAHSVNGSWAVYQPSRSVQGDVCVPHCTIADFVEVTTEKFEPPRPESLSTSLRIPAFDAPPPERGRVERQVMPLAQWRQINGEPAGFEQVLQVAAE
jgi:hypothetical protein